MYLVIGFDSDNHGCPVFMTERRFDSIRAATAYANGCAKAWRAVVVKVVA